MTSRSETPDPRQHALRTLAVLLVRHGPAGPAPEPPVAPSMARPAEEADAMRKAA